MSLPPITLSDLPTSMPLQPNDLFLVRQSLSDKSATLNQIQQAYFPPGTRLFFANANPPPGWTIDVTASDRVLAVAGGVYGPYGSGQGGDWQQGDVDGVPGRGLNVEQMPNHQHDLYGAPGEGGGTFQRFDSSVFQGGGSNASGGHILSGLVLGHNQPNGAALPHNHGNLFRPAAVLGCIGVKQ